MIRKLQFRDNLSDLHGWFDYKEVYMDPELIIIAGDIFKSDYPGEQINELPVFMNEVFPRAYVRGIMTSF